MGKTDETDEIVGDCPTCGRPMRATGVDRLADVDRTRVLGDNAGRRGPRDLSELVLRVACAAGHVWWRAQDS